MAYGGDQQGLTKLKNLASMEINYLGKRRDRTSQTAGLTEELRKMEEKVFKSPFAVPPKGMDLSYPTYIQNISLKLDKFKTDSIIKNEVKKYNLSYNYLDSAITSEILEHNFKVFPEEGDEDYVNNGAVGGDNCQILRSQTKRNLDRLIGKGAKLFTIPYSTKAVECFSESEERSLLSLRVNGEPAPINILIGIDDILGAGLVDEPPTVAHVHDQEDENTHLPPFDHTRISKELRECEIRNHIFYYWYNDIIKAGCVYWMITDGEKFILHDLTSTNHMTPYISSSKVAFDEIENNAIKNAIGLLYYSSALYRWQHKETTKESIAKAVELCERANRMINKEEFPIEWCRANIIFSNYLIPSIINLNEMELLLQMKKPNGTKEYKLKKVVISFDVYDEIKRVVVNSLNRLRNVLKLLVARETVTKKLPMMNSTLPNGTHRLEFDLDTLARDLIKVDVKKMKTTSVIDILNNFVAENGLEFRLLGYVLRKFYLDSVVQARVFQRYDRSKNMMMFCETAIAAWIGLTSILSEERMPLCLRPIHMMGDGYYRLSNNEKKAMAELNNYVVTTEQIVIKEMDKITTAYNVNRTLGLINRERQHLYMRDSFECFARAILYSEVIPHEDVLMRICVVSNDLILAYLDISDESHESYLGEINARQNLANCKLLLDVVFNLVGQFTIEREILAAAYALKARYLRICIHHELKNGKEVDRDICNKFVKVITLLDDAFADLERLNIKIPICKSIVTFEFTVALTDNIFRLQYREDQDKVSYHKNIIPLYARYVNFCRSMFADRIHGPYFKFRAAVGYASIAEYLFGLCKDKETDKLKAEAEKWFEEADLLFSRLPRYSTMELIKTRNDRLAFYDFLITGQSGVLEYDFKTIDILLKSFDLLNTIQETEYKRDSRDVSTNNKRIRIRGVLNALEKRLQNALLRRLTYRQTNKPIDIPRNQLRTLYERSLNRNNLDLLQNLKDLLGEIKTLKDQNFRA